MRSKSPTVSRDLQHGLLELFDFNMANIVPFVPSWPGVSFRVGDIISLKPGTNQEVKEDGYAKEEDDGQDQSYTGS